jgi:predicted nuclease of predicted toxin-antitoxin system
MATRRTRNIVGLAMQLLLDMNISPNWVLFFAANGIESVHWYTQGAATATDAQIFQHALRNKMIIVTHDLDFSAILAATSGSSPSVIQIRSTNLSQSEIGKKVLAAVNQFKSELAAGALLTIDVERTRVRLLPLLRVTEKT